MPQESDRVSSEPVSETVRLRVKEFDALMAKRGVHSIIGQAQACGLARSTLYRIREGGGLRMKSATAMAAACGVSVDALFEVDWTAAA